MPLPSLWNCLTWKDKGERAKSAECILRGNVWGKGLENSWGAGANRRWEGTEMAQGETWEERQGRAVGVEESLWLLWVAELVLGPWAGSVAPSSHELPLLPLLAQLIPSTGPRAPYFLPSVPTGHILCPSLWLPGGELLKKFKIHCAFILQHHLIHGIQVRKLWKNKWALRIPLCSVKYILMSEISFYNIRELSSIMSLKSSSTVVVKGSTLPLPSERRWITPNRWISS